MIHKRSTALEWSVKTILLEGLNRFHRPNLTLSSDVDILKPQSTSAIIQNQIIMTVVV